MATAVEATEKKQENEAIEGEVVNTIKRDKTLLRSTEIYHQGPLPMASEYGAYEAVLKGSANRILKMAEKEQDASIELMNKDWLSQFISMLLGKLFLYALLASSLYLLLKGQKVEGLLAGIAPVVSVMTSIFNKDQNRGNEEERKPKSAKKKTNKKPKK